MARKREVGPDLANPFEAFRAVVYRFGAKDLAPLLGMLPGTLYNKADAGEETHHQPTLRDVIQVTQMTGDMGVVDALNRLFHRAAFDLRPGPVSDEALLELLCRVGSEKGQMAQALRDGLADNHWSREDMQRVRNEGHELIGAVLDFLQRLEGLIDG